MKEEIKITPTQEVFMQPYTISEIAKLYGVNYRTMRKWLKPFEKEIGIKTGRYFNIPQVKIIFSKLDYPTRSSIKPITDV